MLIQKVILDNFGLYRGRHEFDMEPRMKYSRRRPIVLFGGKNGAGKTTLLEAIRLALYGRTVLGPRVRQIDYEAYLRAKIHRSEKDNLFPTNTASVSVIFEYVRSGQKKTYKIERGWRPKGSHGAEEQFALFEGDKVLDEKDRDIAEAFAREIVPEGLSQLFFFDGERIRELADDNTGDTALAEAIKSLLGLDLVERLSADLAIYASRKTAELAADDEQSRLVALAEKSEQLRQRDEQVAEELAALETKIHGVEAEIRQKEDHLRQEGHAFAKGRDDLMAREAVLKMEISRMENDIRTQCERLFPFALCPATAAAVRSQMQIEGERERKKLLSEEVDGIAKGLSQRLRKLAEDEKGPATAAAIDVCKRVVQQYLQEKYANVPADGAPTYLSLSPSESHAVRVCLDAAESESKGAVQSLCMGIEQALAELADVTRQMARIPEDDITQPLLRDIQAYNERLGSLRQQEMQLRAERNTLQLQLQEADRHRRRIEDTIGTRDDEQGKLQQTERIRTALADYLQQLTEGKIQALRRSVVECFNKLAHKGDMIRDIAIDPKTYAVTLYGISRKAISKAELSSGEKQIYAIAMLWGLARTSGRPLPVIIDTPLGRLDSDHRLNLCCNYFPHASHQVILLSTDTEVDEPLFKELSPNISHCYHLRFDPSRVETNESEGYFWKDPAHV